MPREEYIPSRPAAALTLRRSHSLPKIDIPTTQVRAERTQFLPLLLFLKPRHTLRKYPSFRTRLALASIDHEEADSAIGPSFGLLSFRREAVPGINRAAHSVPSGFGLGCKEGEDISEQFQFVALDLNRQRTLDGLNRDQ
jgi:hypothetical protein